MEISVIIPTMNRKKVLFQSLHQILDGLIIPTQIIVIDQTQDKTMAKEIQMELGGDFFKNRVEYYYQEQPSITKARNYGLIKARHDITVFMDDDVEVAYSTFSNIVNIMKNKKIAMIAGLDELGEVSNTK